MSEHENRVFLQDGVPLDHREWLRREVLWASIMSPYDEQLGGWLDEGTTQFHQYSGNVSRQAVYATQHGEEMQSQAYFQQGKKAAGLISSVVMFKLLMRLPADNIDVLSLQASCIDEALKHVNKYDKSNSELPDAHIYSRCAKLAHEATTMPAVASKKYLNASKLMSAVACREATQWVNDSTQNKTGTLPVLTVPNGGYPRSTGTRVNVRQTIFHTILRSAEYSDLAISR